MSRPNELRIFISSTFRDLQEEREHLVKKIFPEIRALCRKRGVTFTEIDLRWGLTDEDVALGQVIRACLDEVDRCRPYFIGITGSRYGYVPSLADIHKDPRLLDDFPWLEDAVIDGMSITEMETYYALLGTDTGKPPCTDALFYFRRERATLDGDDDTADAETQRLHAYQERIRSADATVATFRDPASLGEMIYDDLIGIIKRDFQDAAPPSPLDEERARHEAFSLSRRRAYIPNATALHRLDEHAEGEGSPLIVYAESGSGKSSLFAYWADRYRRRNPEVHLIEHYVGIGATATDRYGVIRHFCMEIAARFGRTEEIPSEPQELDRAFGIWLGYADDELAKRDERLVLILDGLNQLQEQGEQLRWIPDVIAPRIRLMLSSTIEESLVELRRRDWQEYGMQALTDEEREAMVVRYLGEFRKSLNNDQIRQIAGDYKCGHPLFLRTLLEELRLVGRHEDLDRRIGDYLATTGTEDLFQRLLGRLEDDYSSRIVRDVLSTIALSRAGLDEATIAEICHLTRLRVSGMIASLDFHLVRKQGRLTFFHDYLRRAVEKRYLGQERLRKELGARMVAYFEDHDESEQSALDLIAAYRTLGDARQLAEYLSDIGTINRLYRSDHRYEFLTSFKSVTDAGVDLVPFFRASITAYQSDTRPDAERFENLTTMATCLRGLGEFEIGIEIARDCLDIAARIGDDTRTAEAERHAGILEIYGGNYVTAKEHLERSRVLYEKGDDKKGLAKTLLRLGLLGIETNDLEAALVAIERSLEIETWAGDLDGIAVTKGTLGSYYTSAGQHDRALQEYRSALTIAEEIGARTQIASIRTNMGIVQHVLGDHDQAIASMQGARTIVEEIGDRVSAALCLGNIGRMYRSLDQPKEALASWLEAIEVHRGAGTLRPLSYWLVGTSTMLYEYGTSSEKHPAFLASFYPELGRLQGEEGHESACRILLDQAARMAEEVIDISRTIDQSRQEFKSQLLLARITAARGNAQAATARLVELLAEASSLNEEGTRLRRTARTEHALWDVTSNEEHRTNARSIYRKMLAMDPASWIEEELGRLEGA